MLNYEALSTEREAQIRADRAAGRLPDFACPNEAAIRRRDVETDRANLWRTPFIRDIDKIMHCPYYNRYADKTQVFSFTRNDDITRRALHVQLVSRIARTIGSTLNLNLDLIEAIALGHDIGHTPFGHAGESYLDAIYFGHTGRRFSHNVHSVRVLDRIYPLNISLQTLMGIASHDGELELAEYRPRTLTSFDEFDSLIESCYLDRANVKRLVPSTLEGCVMRISDIIAYLGKDRQDAQRASLVDEGAFSPCALGNTNAEIINNLVVNILENSYGKPYILLDESHFNGLKQAKEENYARIYRSDPNRPMMDQTVRRMMERLYDRLLADLKEDRRSSPIFTHHIDYVNAAHYQRAVPYREEAPDDLVVDYIASMTDDYFLDLHAYLFPDATERSAFRGYFDET